MGKISSLADRSRLAKRGQDMKDAVALLEALSANGRQMITDYYIFETIDTYQREGIIARSAGQRTLSRRLVGEIILDINKSYLKKYPGSRSVMSLTSATAQACGINGRGIERRTAAAGTGCSTPSDEAITLDEAQTNLEKDPERLMKMFTLDPGTVDDQNNKKFGEVDDETSSSDGPAGAGRSSTKKSPKAKPKTTKGGDGGATQPGEPQPPRGVPKPPSGGQTPAGPPNESGSNKQPSRGPKPKVPAPVHVPSVGG